MDKMNDFNIILDQCLETVIKGGDIKVCLERYPEYAKELEPLLKTAAATRQAVILNPRPEFKQRAFNDFQAAIREMPEKVPRRGFRWRAAWMTPLAVFIALVIAGSGTVAASSGSLPDSPLYQVKLATEAVQLAFTPSSLGKAELYARFTDRRVEELINMAEKGKMGQVEKITERMNDHLAAMIDLTGGSGEVAADKGTLAMMAPEMTQPYATDEVPPSTLQTPAPTTTSQPVPAVVPGPERGKAGGASGGIGQGKAANGKETGGKLNSQQRLREILTGKEAVTLQKLQEALENAPESLKPSLQRAIDVILSGYDITISNLDG